MCLSLLLGIGNRDVTLAQGIRKEGQTALLMEQQRSCCLGIKLKLSVCWESEWECFAWSRDEPWLRERACVGLVRS